MGSAISQSHGYWTITVFGDGTYMVENYKAIQNSKNAKDNNLMRYSIISVLPWNKNVVISAKVKDSKKVKPHSNYQKITHLNNENLKVSHSRAKASNAAHALLRQAQKQHVKPSSTTNTVSSVKKFPKTVSLMSPKRVVEHALTNELLTCLGEFLCRRCYRLTRLSPTDPVHWLRSVDKALLLQGWQDQGFICPASMVFLYMLCREVISSEVASENELQAVLLTCLYLSYSYVGNEISYPVKPFLVKKCKNGFWNCCLSIINLMSSKMLQLNYDDHFFTEVFVDLKNENSQGEKSQLSIVLDR